MSDLTYLDLQNEVAARLVRTDLTNEIRTQIQERCLHYGKEFFYSSEIVDTSITTIGGQRYYDLPVRWADVRFVQVKSGVWIPMERKDHLLINSADNLTNALQSLPSVWATFGGQLRIWPCGPGYPLQIVMNTSPAAPVSDADVTFWSTDAQTLIIAATAEEICRQVIADPIREEKYKFVREVEERSLASKSIREMGGVKFKGRN